MKTYIYQIEAITNLHVGNGEANEGVVDRLIQKDPITGYPIINASSLKGAIREHINHSLKNDPDKDKIMLHIFGNEVNYDKEKDNKDNKSKNKHQAGAYRFFDANLLSLPVRNNKVAYLMASTYSILNNFETRLKLFNTEENFNLKLDGLSNINYPIVSNLMYDKAILEDLAKKAKLEPNNCFTANLNKLIGSPNVLLPETDFKTLCNEDHLPIIARNQLENGESQNLWYEQVLPRMSRLYFLVMAPVGDEYFEKFDTIISDSLVQIGANASVGYGYCSIKKISANDL